jgi:hypothetical protein
LTLIASVVNELSVGELNKVIDAMTVSSNNPDANQKRLQAGEGPFYQHFFFGRNDFVLRFRLPSHSSDQIVQYQRHAISALARIAGFSQ